MFYIQKLKSLKRYQSLILAHRNLFNSLQYQEAKNKIQEIGTVRYLNCAFIVLEL